MKSWSPCSISQVLMTAVPHCSQLSGHWGQNPLLSHPVHFPSEGDSLMSFNPQSAFLP